MRCAGAVALALCLSGCAGDAYTTPPIHAGAVEWLFVNADDVTKFCGQHPACEEDGTIITQIPEAGDYALLDILRHEIAHAQGWQHPTPPGL